ncbi:MAG TPA: SRPBCC family protein [Acidimicrobiales bacterium]|nr:SRPBCC family protein [Acidimicrobiales bacterium]
MTTYGELHDEDGRGALRFVRRYPHPPERVWQALTEPEHLAHWFPTDIEGDRAAGATLRFVFRSGEGPEFEGTMLTCDPPKLLEFMWGPDLLRFELAADDGGTVLTLTDVLSEFGKGARDAAGWHQCLDALSYVVDDETVPASVGERWREVSPYYIDRFPAEAATIGPPQT